MEAELLEVKRQMEEKEAELNKVKNRQSDAIYDFDRFWIIY